MNGMKFLRAGTVVCMVVFGIMTCRAGVGPTIEHCFNTLGGRIAYNVDYTIGTVDGSFVYTCDEGASFGLTSGSKICILLAGGDDFVTTSKVTGLREIKVYVEKANPSKDIDITKIKIYASTTGTWGDPLTCETTSGVVTATIPVGSYYVKIAYTGSNTAALSQIDYYRSDCNCQPYVAP